MYYANLSRDQSSRCHWQASCATRIRHANAAACHHSAYILLQKIPRTTRDLLDFCVFVMRVYFLCVLANVNSRLRLLHVVAHPSVSLSVCRLSVTFLRPTQPVEIFGNVCTPFARLPWPSVDIQVKFYGDCSRGTPPSGEGLNARGVAEYNDFGPVKGYISETVQDRRYLVISKLNRKLHELSIGTKSVTLNDLERHNGLILR